MDCDRLAPTTGTVSLGSRVVVGEVDQARARIDADGDHWKLTSIGSAALAAKA